MLPLSLSYDHRVIDGAAAARFMRPPREGAGRPAAGAAVSAVDVLVPDIGDFTDVPVVEILVAVGDEVEADAPLVVLESDKATMEIPAPQAGTVKELKVEVGDTVSEGTVLAIIDASRRRRRAPRRRVRATSRAGRRAEAAAAPASAIERGDVHAGVLVLGSGPGGYAAAFRAADLGLEVVLVERYDDARRRVPQRRLHPVQGAAARREGHRRGRDARHARRGVRRAGDRPRRAARVEGRRRRQAHRRPRRHGQAAQGAGRARRGALHRAAHARGRAATGRPRSRSTTRSSPRARASVRAARASRTTTRASWTRPARSSSRTSPSGCSSSAAGSSAWRWRRSTTRSARGVTVVELADQLIPGCDPDLVRPLQKRITERYEAIHLGTKVESVEAKRRRPARDVRRRRRATRVFDRVLVAVGRTPNGAGLGLDAAGVEVDERGFVGVDDQLRTNVPHIFAIGDVARPPMLAHKATAEGHVAAEVIAGQDVAYDVRAMPSVAYTEPEVAWVGLTETEAKARRRRVREGGVPVVGVGPRAGDRRRERHDEAARRPRDAARARRGHRRHERRRAARRGRRWRSRWARTSRTSG